jgi:hypothetical protein
MPACAFRPGGLPARCVALQDLLRPLTPARDVPTSTGGSPVTPVSGSASTLAARLPLAHPAEHHLQLLAEHAQLGPPPLTLPIAPLRALPLPAAGEAALPAPALAAPPPPAAAAAAGAPTWGVPAAEPAYVSVEQAAELMLALRGLANAASSAKHAPAAASCQPVMSWPPGTRRKRSTSWPGTDSTHPQAL